MCGIFGEYCFTGEGVSLRKSIEKLDMLAHRGPDGYGCAYGNLTANAHHLFFCRSSREITQPDNMSVTYFLGHRRLSIVDLNDNAFQPMESHDGRYSIIFNGEIYNYIELRQELQQAGCIFQTDHSDTEVLLNAYIQWGPQCLKRFRGMFAFAIFDRNSRIVFLARDRIGKKPLYYHLNHSRFAFASEIGPLLESETGQRWKISRQALSFYMVSGYVPHPITIFEEIQKLPPASFATVDLALHTIDIQEYWDVKLFDDTEKNSEQFLEEVDTVLSEAVTIRLRADVPLGAFISGGTDSTLIIKKIHDMTSHACDIFGADFPQPEQSEGEYIKAVAKRYSQKLHLAMIDNENAQSISDIVKVFDEPFDGGSSIALFELFSNVHRGFKVILTGDGGDELFAGYPRYIENQPNQQTAAWRSIAGKPARVLGSLTGSHRLKRKANSWIQYAQGDFWTRYFLASGERSLHELVIDNGAYHPEYAEIYEEVRKKVPHPELSPIKALQYLELKTILPGRMLYKLDRFSMRFGVEARSPLLDHRLAELAFSIPSRFNISKTSTKILLKKLLEKDFPAAFVHRKKHGFGNPLSHWFSASYGGRHFDILNNRSSLIYEYIDHDRFHERFPQIKSGFSGDGEKVLWRFLVLAHYLENFKHHISG